MTENNQNNILDFEISDEDIKNVFSNKDLDKTEKRETFLKNLNQYLEVQAVPGSGKTKILGVKIGLLLKKWKYKNNGICILTHTNVAKEEILKSYREINQNCELEHFPHFIGTIQEFVDKFLAIPYLKSNGFSINQILDKHYYSSNILVIAKSLSYHFNGKYINNYSLDEKQNLYNVISHSFYKEENIISCNNKDYSSKTIFSELKIFKEENANNGYFLYNDMYAFANALIRKNSIVLNYIRNRFKICFIDEAQDTNKIQGELLKKIFKESEHNIFQILGDNNQKIYDFDSNNDYSIFDNNSGNLIKMNKTYRFCNSIGNLVNNFAMDKNDIAEYYSKENKFDKKPCLILYDDPKDVLTKFLEILEENNLIKIDKKFLIIGAVGKEKNNTVISSYIENFSKNNNENKFKTKNIIEALNFVRKNKFGDFKENYKIIFNALLYNFDNDGYISNSEKSEKKTTAKENLEKICKENSFNQKIIEILNDKNEITEEFVEKILFSGSIKQLFNFKGLFEDVNNSNKLEQNKKNISESTVSTSKNKYSYQYNFSENEIELSNNEDKNLKFKIKVNTIHGVKGETHDATLVLETQYYKLDISYFLNHPEKDKSGRLDKHNLYVAFSRPKTLLCLASDKGNYTTAKLEELKEFLHIISI